MAYDQSGSAREHHYLHMEGREQLTVVDVYCGTGTISLYLARHAKKVYGIEIVAPAIENAKRNAEENKCANAEFILGDAAVELPKLLNSGVTPDVVLVDPPRADLNFAWPSSEIAVMGASGAVAVLCGKEAKAKKEAGEDVKAFLAEKEQEYTDKFANPYQAAQYGYIDDVIEPRNTRFRICRGLAQLATKRQSLPAKKHGCI